MSQSYTPYSYQGNNIFNMGTPWWQKKRLLESPITLAEAQSMSTPFMQVNEVDLRGPGRIPVAEGGSGMHPRYERNLTPEARQTYTGYTKSLDKAFAVAALQSAIPQNDQTPAQQAPTSGGRGGGNRMNELTQYASAIPLDEEKYPMLWRYS